MRFLGGRRDLRPDEPEAEMRFLFGDRVTHPAHGAGVVIRTGHVNILVRFITDALSKDRLEWVLATDLTLVGRNRKAHMSITDTVETVWIPGRGLADFYPQKNPADRPTVYVFINQVPTCVPREQMLRIGDMVVALDFELRMSQIGTVRRIFRLGAEPILTLALSDGRTANRSPECVRKIVERRIRQRRETERRRSRGPRPGLANGDLVQVMGPDGLLTGRIVRPTGKDRYLVRFRPSSSASSAWNISQEDLRPLEPASDRRTDDRRTGVERRRA